MDSQEVVVGTIDDYLLSIARALKLVQSELDRPAGKDGAIGYALPKVDFEIRTYAHLTDSETVTNRYSDRARMGPLRKRQIVFSPAGPPGGDNATAELSSTISGTFVATSPQAAQAVILRSATSQTSARELSVRVTVLDSSGSPVAGRAVEFNVDREESARMTGRGLKPATDFLEGIVVSDESGVATSTLRISPQEPAGSIVVISLDVAGATEVLLYRFGQ